MLREFLSHSKTFQKRKLSGPLDSILDTKRHKTNEIVTFSNFHTDIFFLRMDIRILNSGSFDAVEMRTVQVNSPYKRFDAVKSIQNCVK